MAEREDKKTTDRFVTPPLNHDVTIAALAAIALPGAGQLYNNQSAKGFLLMVLPLVGLSVILMRPRGAFVVPLVIGVLLCAWVIGIMDAALIAGRFIRGEPVRAWQWF